MPDRSPVGRAGLARNIALVALAVVLAAGFSGGAVGRRRANNPFIARAVGRVTLGARGPSAVGFGFTDVSQPLNGTQDAVCITTSRPVAVAVATPEDDASLTVRSATVAVPPAAGRCPDGADVLVRLVGGQIGDTINVVAY